MTRRRLVAFALLAGLANPRPAVAQLLDTDIFLASLTRVADSLVVGPVVNITRRPGYDNQPAFLPDATALLYTSIGSDGQADIWRYDIPTRQRTRLTSTAESEYSPTVIRRGADRRLLVVRVERDSTQRLWSFALDGSDPRLELPALKPVGYFAILDSARLVTFVLGSLGAPSTLHVVHADGSGDEVRARNVGRSLGAVPGRTEYSFTQPDSAGVRWILTQPVAGGVPRRLVRAAADNEFHVWTSDGTLLTVSDGVLLSWNGARDLAASGWRSMADLRPQALRKVSRIAVSPDGRWIAMVAEGDSR